MRHCGTFLSALKPTRLGALFAVLIGFGVGFWQWGQPPQPRVVVENVDWLWAAHQFSPDGRTVAISQPIDPDGRNVFFSLWDAQTGAKKVDLFKGEQPPTSVAYSPDGRTIAACYENKISVWDVSSGKELAIRQDSNRGGQSRQHTQLAFSPDGKLLAVGQDNLSSHFSPDGIKLLALAWDYSLWDVLANKVIKKLAQQSQGVAKVKGVSFVLGDRNVVKVWDVATGSLCAEIRMPGNGMIPSCIELSKDRQFLLYQLHGGLQKIFVFNLITKQEIEIAAVVERVVISPDNQTIACELVSDLEDASWWVKVTDWLGIREDSSAFSVSLRAFPAGDEITVLKNCISPVFSPDGKTLAVLGLEGNLEVAKGNLQLYDLPIRKPIVKILGLAGLAALATVLLINGLGWLRRRRGKKPAHLIASGSAAVMPMPETK
jgi:WD40 repeat protein